MTPSVLQCKQKELGFLFTFTIKGGRFLKLAAGDFFGARAGDFFGAHVFMHFDIFCVVLSVNTVRASISAQFASSHACIAVHTEENGSK